MDVLAHAFLVANALSAQCTNETRIRDKTPPHGLDIAGSQSKLRLPHDPTASYPTGASTWFGSYLPFTSFAPSLLEDCLGNLLAAVLDVGASSRSQVVRTDELIFLTQ